MNGKADNKNIVKEQKKTKEAPVTNETKKTKPVAAQSANVSMDDRCLVPNTAEDARPDNGDYCHDGRDGE